MTYEPYQGMLNLLNDQDNLDQLLLQTESVDRLALSVRDVETLRFVRTLLRHKYPDLYPGFQDLVLRLAKIFPLGDVATRDAVVDFEHHL